MRFHRSAKRLTALLGAVIATALVVAGCGSGGGSSAGGTGGPEAKPAAGGTLRVATFAEPITLNPFEAVDNGSEQVFMQVVQTLFETAPDGKVEPLLATEAKQTDNYKTWTLPLRSGVRFTDGRPLTAEDVVFSLDQIREGAGWGSLYESIKDVKAKTPTEVEIITSKPFPGLTALLALPFAAVVEKDYGGMTAKEFAQKPVGTGPFELSSWKHGQSLTLVKNPDYWEADKPYLDKLVITIPASDQARVLQLRGEQADAIARPPTSQVAALEQTPGIRIEKSPDAISNYLILNVRNELLANPKVREAIDLAVDREAINKVASNGTGEINGSWLMPAVNYWDGSIKPSPMDTAKAKALVSEAVAESGLAPKLTIGSEASESFSVFASQILQEDLKAIGIEVQIKSLESSTLLEELETGNYDAAIFGLSTDIVDPSELVSYYIGLEGFFSGANTTEMAKVLDKASVEADPAKLKSLYAETQQIVADQKELIVLNYVPWIWALSEKVTGFQLNAMGLPLYVNAGLTE